MKKHILLLSFMSLYPHINAQVNLDYQKPDKAILELADVPLPPATFVDAKGENAFMAYRDRYKSIAELSEMEMRLGGLRINPKTNINSREIFYFNLTYYDLKTGKEITIKGLNEDGRYSNFGWSYNQKKLSFTNTTDKGVELWVVDVGSKSAKRIVDAELNANLGKPYTWLPNNTSLLVNILPKNRTALIDTKEHIPSGPIISESDGREAQNRTYQDLLQNKEDEFNFELLTTSEIYKVNLKGEKTAWKASGMYTNLTPSPDGTYVLVTEIHKPFSYLVPYQRFPFTETIYDENAKPVKEVLNAPLEEDRPKGFMSTRKGIREVNWRLDKEANIYWTEALDEGDADIKVDFRDAVFELEAPFNGEKRLLLKTIDRFSGIDWGTHEMAIVYDYWWNTRNRRDYLFNPSDNKLAPKAFHNRNYQDKYNDPGYFITERNQYGRQQLLIEKGKLLLKGEGYSAEGILPFIDEFDLKTLKTARLWRALKGDQLENIISIINPKKGLILERIQSKTSYPNYYIRNIFQKGGIPKQVTFFKNPFESLQNVHKEIITYKREDGVKLSATLYLPPQYNKKEKLPMLMWAYPQEFKDNATAGQITASSNEFIAPWYGSPIFWVMRGYAVLDDAAFPIVGEGENEPNDTFISQLVENAKAAIDAVDKLGYIDRKRVAVGGHSYGAFMTANLLSHSDLFAAGIARSGAYNRTLTPFGFQAEERNYWQAAEVYNKMSPFMSADKMKHPLLLVHGEEDNNSGTYPMQSERYFNALKGLGATARLVILPKESHGYASKESVLHLLWEQDQWLEKYVKNKAK